LCASQSWQIIGVTVLATDYDMYNVTT